MPRKKKMQHPFLNEANNNNTNNNNNKSQKEPVLSERDKQALATWGYQCEDCGEFHELEDEYELDPHDEYEFGAHDEYEEMGCPKHKRKNSRGKCVRIDKDRQFTAGAGSERRHSEASKIAQGSQAESKRLKQRQQHKKVMGEVIETGMLRSGPPPPPKKKNYTSEPIPDYIMRALQPKKSVHPEYGKLRY